MTLLDHALAYAGLGLEIFPVGPDKAPLASQLRATTDLDQLEAWWRRWPDAAIGHRISPHHVLLDIDPRHGGKETWAALKREARDFRTRTHYSGRNDGGGHVWFQRPADKLTVTKLDAWAKERELGAQIKQRWTSGIDLLRHEHRYTILPPSLHPETGRAYWWAQGKGIAVEPAPMPAMLAELLIADDLPAPAPSGPQYRDPDSIADWYSERTSWVSLLGPAGWTLVSGDGNEDGSRWRHPEATTSVSATIRHGCLFVYSTNTPFEPTGPGEPHGYTPFAAWAVLCHEGDQAVAGREARKLKGSGVSENLTSDRPTGASTPSGTRQSGSEDESGAGRQVSVTWASGIALRRVKWCWEGRLAVGTLGLLAGPEGLGKSTVACTIGAELTRGNLPGEHQGRPRPVLVAATEDSWSHTIAPRFLAAEADLSRVGRIDVTVGDHTLPISLPDDLEGLARLIGDTGAALLILDPLISRLSAQLDSHRDGEVRQALEPLVAIAEETGVAIVGLIHHNKSGRSDPLDLVMASKAFTAVARSVHTVIRDPDDETGRQRYFGTPKNNLGTIDLPTLTFTIEPHVYETSEGDGSTGRIAWGPTHAERIDDLLRRAQSKAEGKVTKTDKATEWLRDHMEANGGVVWAHEAMEAFRQWWAANEKGSVSDDTLRKEATKRLDVSHEKVATGGWRWHLPEQGGKGERGKQTPNPSPLVCKGESEPDVPKSSPFPPSNTRSPQGGKGERGKSPRARARAREGEIDPEQNEIDPELHAPDGSPWCRPDGRGGCLNGSRCLNPRHGRRLESDESKERNDGTGHEGATAGDSR